MAIGLEDKRAIVAQVRETAASALSLVVADPRGCTVEQMTGLRRDARERRIALRMVRNTLARRAFEGTEYECVAGALAGPSLFGFSMEEPGAAARLFKDFAAQNETFTVKALAFGGQLLDAGQLDALASLPTRDAALAMLMGAMRAPLSGLASALGEVPARLVRAVAAVRDLKRASAA